MEILGAGWLTDRVRDRFCKEKWLAEKDDKGLNYLPSGQCWGIFSFCTVPLDLKHPLDRMSRDFCMHFVRGIAQLSSTGQFADADTLLLGSLLCGLERMAGLGRIWTVVLRLMKKC